MWSWILAVWWLTKTDNKRLHVNALTLRECLKAVGTHNKLNCMKKYTVKWHFGFNINTKASNTIQSQDMTRLPTGISQCQKRKHFKHTSNWLFKSRDPGAQFTKYLMIYHKIIAKSTYESDLGRAKISLRNIISKEKPCTVRLRKMFCRLDIHDKSILTFTLS